MVLLAELSLSPAEQDQFTPGPKTVIVMTTAADFIAPYLQISTFEY